MKYVFLLIVLLLLLPNTGSSQCFDLLEKKLNTFEKIPYEMVDRFVFDIPSSQPISIKIKDGKYKSKLGFMFQFNNLGDTLYVSLYTLNRKLLASKKITNDDCFLRYEPFIKSENYFLIVHTQKQPAADKQKTTGCLGLAIVERVKRKGLKEVQKITWGKDGSVP